MSSRTTTTTPREPTEGDEESGVQSTEMVVGVETSVAQEEEDTLEDDPPASLLLSHPAQRLSRQQDAPPVPVQSHHTRFISAKSLDATKQVSFSTREPERPQDLQHSSSSGYHMPNRQPDPDDPEDCTISVFAKYDEVQACVESIQKWVRDCHQDEPVEDNVFPTNATIRGTSLLWDLDRLAELFYEEYINRNETGLEDATQLIVDTVASIPGFVKTVLLIDKETERMQVMQKRFMKRVLLSHRALCRAGTDDSEQEDEDERLRSSGAQPNDFGGVVLESWLLALLDSHETTRKIRAVDYMEFVSNLTLKDYLQATVSKKENKPGGESEAELREKFHETRSELFDKVATLPHLLVLLITLPVEQVERASVVGMVQWALYKALKKPFVTFMNFCDFFFHLSLLGIWRLFLLLDVRYAQGADEDALWGSWVFGFVVAIACIMYFSYRWVGDIISLARIKVQLAVKFVLSLQTLVQITLVVLVIVSTVGSGIASTSLSGTITSATYTNVTAVSLGFLWLKVVLFLQIVNQKMAAYIIALVQILTNDIFFFAIIMFATVIGFGDMLFTLYATDPVFCTPWTAISDYVGGGNATFIVWGDNLYATTINDFVGVRLNETFFELSKNTTDYSLPYLNINDFQTQRNLLSKNPFCKSRLESYFTIYRIYLGNFNFGDFRKNHLTTFLFVLITFIALIVLLNLLIAIFQLSYLLSIKKSERLFGRARLTFVAQILALEDLLLPNERGKVRRHQGRELLMHHFIRVVTIGLLVVAALLVVVFSDYAAGYVVDGGTYETLFVTFCILGLIPIAVLAINIFVAWDKPKFERKSVVARFSHRSQLIKYVYKVPIKLFSCFVLQIPLRDRVQWERLFGGQLDSRKSTKNNHLDSAMKRIEERVDSMEARLEAKFDQRLSQMEDLIVSRVSERARKPKQA